MNEDIKTLSESSGIPEHQVKFIYEFAQARVASENLHLRTHHTALLSALTKLADQGYWSKRAKESWMRVVLDEYVDFAKDALASLKPPSGVDSPSPHPAEKGSGT